MIDFAFLHGFSTEIASSILGAGVVWLFVASKNTIHHRRMQARYPLAGIYTSRYDDKVSGVSVERKAEVTFRQQGLRLSGVTTNLDDARGWNIDLTIEKDRFLHGLYRAEHPGDGGTGMVFLQWQPDGALQGVWAGYDSLNKTVEAGKYLFKRIPDIKVDETNSVHQREEAMSLLSSELGDKYISSEAFAAYATDRDRRKIALVATTRQKGRAPQVVGVLLAQIVPAAEFGDTLLDHGAVLMKRPDLFRFRRQDTGLIRSIAVDPSYRGRGIATVLVRDAIRQLREQGARSFYALGWMSKDEEPAIANVLHPFGFKDTAVLKEFWLRDSRDRGYDCPTCGHPCHCAALLMVTGDDAHGESRAQLERIDPPTSSPAGVGA